MDVIPSNVTPTQYLPVEAVVEPTEDPIPMTTRSGCTVRAPTRLTPTFAGKTYESVNFHIHEHLDSHQFAGVTIKTMIRLSEQ